MIKKYNFEKIPCSFNLCPHFDKSVHIVNATIATTIGGLNARKYIKSCINKMSVKGVAQNNEWGLCWRKVI